LIPVRWLSAASAGETAFPAIGLSVSPRRGQAVCFEYCNAAGDRSQRFVGI